ncbi:hypothetical protein [Chitinophaga sp. CF118]|uniref:hypothetical protein n=1 Tax=Chitinophaga sp. CF118 TaxID=1884367 RepID=UPI0011607CB9|nr:hypothetical protein [Chitinophaga sp. CF118]
MHLRLRHCLLLLIGLPAFAQTPRTDLHFTSSKQQKITVYKGTIFVNGNRAYQLASDAIVYTSRRNRLVEDNGNVFLFLEVTKTPNKNRLYVFGINNSKADSLMDAISSDVKDMDHDGFLEFGGSDITATYPSNDSMYYIPAKYYEIKRGLITFDAAYTEKMDKKVNGTYISEPLDKSGNCCKVIPKPKSHY